LWGNKTLNTLTLCLSMLLLWGGAVWADAAVLIDGSVEYQTMEGFGGNWGGCLGIIDGTMVDMTVADLAFDSLGISVSRESMPDDFHTDPEYSWKLLTFAESATRGVKTFFVCGVTPKRFRGADDHLLPQYYDSYANYIADWIEDVKSRTGVEITYFSVQTEPDNFWSKWGPYTPEEMTDFIKVLGSVFENRGINSKIGAPECFAADQTQSYLASLLGDPAALRYLSVINYHLGCWNCCPEPWRWNYGCSTIADLQYIGSISSAYGIPTQMTEQSTGSEGQTVIKVAKWIHYSLVYANSSVWLWARLISAHSTGDYTPLVFIDTSVPQPWPGSVTKNGYQFKQFSKYIRPGAVRISAVSDDDRVLVSAFKHPYENTVAIVAINDDASSISVSFRINGLGPLNSLSVYRTSASENCEDKGSVDLSANSFTAVLPARSVTTFTGTVGEVPRTSSGYHGSLTIDGYPAPAGTVVSAWVEGSSDTVSVTTEVPGQYAILLSSPGGGAEGRIVHFRVTTQAGTFDALPTGLWESGVDHRVDLTGTGMVVTPPTLNFGRVQVGRSDSLTLMIENIGVGDLPVMDLNWSCPDFDVSDTSFTVPPGGSVKIVVCFSPTGALTYADTLAIVTRTVTLRVPVSAEGEKVHTSVSSSPSSGEGSPDTYALFQNYPNPFYPLTAIPYQIPEGTTVKLEIYDVLGEKLRTLVDGFVPSGHYVAEWDGRDEAGRPVANGIYFYRLEVKGRDAKVGKMCLIYRD